LLGFIFLFKLFILNFYFKFLIEFLIFFLEKKNLFGCGNNFCKQKGIFKYEDEILLYPTKIEFFKDKEIENVFTGFESTFIKTKSKF
jgi:hypothetical protein